jgi:hypothetical protein
MEPTRESVAVRPARRVRLIEQAGDVVAYPEPHRTPVLPAGWAPLSRDQQEAVQRACDAAPECLMLKLGSLWEPGCEYRVYHLTNEQWAGLSVVCKFAAAGSPTLCNGQLLGLSWNPVIALQIATDFFNWDLEAHGHHWRLRAESVETDDSDEPGPMPGAGRPRPQ